MIDLYQIWVYLSGSPLFSLLITLLFYEISFQLYQSFNKNPWLNPVALSVVLICFVLWLSNLSYQDYFSGAQFVHFLLGTATVALALPIFKAWQMLRGKIFGLIFASILGGAVSVGTVILLSKWFNVPEELAQPLWVKSVTAPIAMGIAEKIGAAPTLAAVYAVMTGILGSIMLRPLLSTFHSNMPLWQRGFTMGVSAHGIGTSTAFTINETMGIFAGIGMVLHGIIGAFLLPFLL